MRARAPLLALAAAASLGAGPATWHHPAPGESPGGLPQDISLSANGSILLAPASREILPGEGGFAAPPLLVAVETDVEGNTFFGGGMGAQVLRVNEKGEVHTFFETTGVGVRALSSDISGYLLVATMPNGRVYRVDSDGSAEVLFQPEERYLWAMSTDAFDRTFLATGERGVVYSISGPGEATVFFDSDEPHITSLAGDPAGRLLAGSSGRGLVYRISDDGSAEVILDSGLTEVSAITVGSDGTVFAAAILDPGPLQPRRRANGRDELMIEVTAAEDDEMLEEAAEGRRKVVVDLGEILPAVERAEGQAASRVYRIAPGRTPMVLWSSPTEFVYSLVIDSRGHLLVGTGPSGRLYRIEPDLTATLLKQYPATQVTSLAAGRDGEVWVLTSNPGRVYRLEAEPAESGSYLSPVHDAGNIAAWGTLRWDADHPKGTRVSFAARSGNTPDPDATWSGWSEPMDAAGGSSLQAPPARYVQWRATLSRLRTETTPVVRTASLTYLPENLPPEIRSVRVGEPGADPAVAEGAPPAPAGKEGEEPVPDGRSLWITWRSTDPDGDPLRHAVSIRREEDPSWLLLAEDVREHAIALDPAGRPEGRYVARIDVNDLEVNGPRRGREASARSSGFVVDNTPPSIDARAPDMGEESVTIRFSAGDLLSAVTRAEWSSEDRGPWAAVLPNDGIGDTGNESFELVLPLEGLERQIHLRVTDGAGNSSTMEISLPRWQ